MNIEAARQKKRKRTRKKYKDFGFQMAVTKPHYQADKTAIEELKGSHHGYIIKPRGLSIVWGNDERYWKIPKGDKDSNEPAELIRVSWLEVTSSVDLEPQKKYEISFDVELALDAFGWRDLEVFLMAKVGKKGKYSWTKINLVQDSSGGRFPIPIEGPFTISSSSETNADNTLHFGLYEVWSGKWKGGLKIHKVTVTDVTVTDLKACAPCAWY